MDSERTGKTQGTSFQIIASEDYTTHFSPPEDDFGSGFKTCKTCGVPQPMNSFRKEKSGVGGRKASCRGCMAENKPKPKRLKVDHQSALTAAYYLAIKEGII
jgi:hypothetical protein